MIITESGLQNNSLLQFSSYRIHHYYGTGEVNTKNTTPI